MTTTIVRIIGMMSALTSCLFGADLTVKITGLRNTNGIVIVSLYNRTDAFPDEDFQKRITYTTTPIHGTSAKVVFKSVAAGKYAVNILHDENGDGRINKRGPLPMEGIGFSNYTTIGFLNRPSFSKAVFSVTNDTTVSVVTIYKI